MNTKFDCKTKYGNINNNNLLINNISVLVMILFIINYIFVFIAIKKETEKSKLLAEFAIKKETEKSKLLAEFGKIEKILTWLNEDETELINSKDTPATCALCGKDHPAKFRGCAVHKELQESRNMAASTTHEDVSRRPLDSNHPDKQHSNWEKKTQGKPPSNATYSRSYADTIKPPNPNSQSHEFSSSSEPPPATLFSSFLEHFQSLIINKSLIITPLINLLTTLINTILTKNDN